MSELNDPRALMYCLNELATLCKIAADYLLLTVLKLVLLVL